MLWNVFGGKSCKVCNQMVQANAPMLCARGQGRADEAHVVLVKSVGTRHTAPSTCPYT